MFHLTRVPRFASPLLALSLFCTLLLSAHANPPASPKPILRLASAGKPATSKTVSLAGKPAPTLTAKPRPTASPALKPAVVKVAVRVPGFNDPRAPGNNWQASAVEIVAAGKGRINYEASVVKAIGLGALAPPTLTKSRSQDILDAREAALADALRVLGMAASQVRVTADTRVANYILKSDDIRVRVESVIKNAEVMEEKMLPTSGVYRLIVSARLTGPNSILEAVTPTKEETGEKTEKVVATKSEPTPVAVESKPDPFAPGMPAPEGAEYSSLIVDCRGLNMGSCMSPKIYDEDGSEVYGTMKIAPEYVIETGIASFPRSMKEARGCPRAGNRPLIVRAHRVADENRYYAVISRSDAERARAANQSSHYFERTAIALLLDPIR